MLSISSMHYTYFILVFVEKKKCVPSFNASYKLIWEQLNLLLATANTILTGSGTTECVALTIINAEMYFG